MKKAKFLSKIALAASFALAFALTFSCSTSENEDEKQEVSSSSGDVSGGYISSNSGGESSSSLGDIQAAANLRAKPVPAVPQGSKPDVLYSWTDWNKNYYIINAGYIENSLLMENGFHYSGVGHVGISTTETSENSITENRTNSVSNSIVVSNGSTISETNTMGLREAITAGVKTGSEVGAEAGAFGVKGSVKASVEASIEGTVEQSTEFSSAISRSFETSTGRTTETSESFGTTLRQSWSTSTSLAANTGDPAGYYRYAWYVTSDVYFVISTSLKNQELLSWEVVSIPREKLELRQEYSPTAFDNSPVKGSEIVFADDFYKTLQEPTDIAAIGVFFDTRDGKKYKYAKISTQVWMAENLNYNVSGGACYENKESNCNTYGRLYKWTTARTVCPSGWHLPTKEEWETLVNYVENEKNCSSCAGKYLKARNGWSSNGNGEDTYGFTLLPGGGATSGMVFYHAGEYGNWWTTSEFDINHAYYADISHDTENLNIARFDKEFSRSVRCVKD